MAVSGLQPRPGAECSCAPEPPLGEGPRRSTLLSPACSELCIFSHTQGALSLTGVSIENPGAEIWVPGFPKGCPSCLCARPMSHCNFDVCRKNNVINMYKKDFLLFHTFRVITKNVWSSTSPSSLC